MSDARARTMAKITTLIEAGLNPEEIARNLQEEASKAKIIELEGESDDETFPDEIKVIAQALAFRNANLDDSDSIKSTLKCAYRCEIEGPESFRKGSVMNDAMVESLLLDSSYSWILVEAPNGQGVEEDGKLLGVCCFSTDGLSKRNGEIEGKLGSIRLLGVLPRFIGVCVGRRLLSKAEESMRQSGCCRSMICIAETRKSMHSWIERRGYNQVNSVPYPRIGHDLTAPISLDVFVKGLAIPASTGKSQGDLADTADTVEGPPSPPAYPSSSNSETQLPPRPQPGRMSLPPHWRFIASSEQVADAAAPGSGASAEDIPDVD